jgi:hypothetical protein
VRSSGFCRSMSPRARLWTARTSPIAGYAFGATACSTELPRSRAITEWVPGQGQRNTAPRHSPRRLLVAETSPQPGPPSGASCRGHHPFTLPGAARGEEDTAIARRACRATPSRGPCDTRLPRRNPMLTSPRHLPSEGRSRANEGFCLSAELAGKHADAFFTAGGQGGGRPHKARTARSIGSRDRRTSLSSIGPQRPL